MDLFSYVNALFHKYFAAENKKMSVGVVCVLLLMMAAHLHCWGHGGVQAGGHTCQL